MEFIEQVEIRTHKELPQRKNGSMFEYGYGYKTVFRDCLPGKDWLEAHHQDIIPESSIDILVDGVVKASINSNYKRGMIKQLIKQYKPERKGTRQ